jgi:predicted ATPase
MSRIKIKNFGPIKEGMGEEWIEIKKVSVFIGNQGSGKSTIAKIISTLIWIEKALVRGDFSEFELTESGGNTFKDKFEYQNIYYYFKNNTYIEYEGKAYSIIYNNFEVKVAKSSENGYFFPKIMYVPDTRNLGSAVDNPATLKQLPAPLSDFLYEFEKAKLELTIAFDPNNGARTTLIPLGINNVSFMHLERTNESFIIGETANSGNLEDHYKIKLSQASSGFQSFVPLYLVSMLLSLLIKKKTDDTSIKKISIDEQRRIKKETEAILSNPNLSDEVRKASLEILSSKTQYLRFVNIIEEPEQNLFPSSQWELLKKLLEFNNMSIGNELIITTHSPYLVNYLSIAIQADYLKEKIIENSNSFELNNKLEKIISNKSTVAGLDVAIYQLDEQSGTIKLLPNNEGIPSDNNYLNQSLRHGNEMFDNLLEIEQEL